MLTCVLSSVNATAASRSLSDIDRSIMANAMSDRLLADEEGDLWQTFRLKTESLKF